MSNELATLREAWEEIPSPTDVERASARAQLLHVVATSDPRRRWRRPRRGQVLLCAALLLGLLGAVPALSGRSYDHVFDWLGGEPSQEVVEQVEQIDLGAPEGMEQRPIPSKTGKVYERRTRYGVVRIWLTPTKNGGYCKSFEAPDAGGTTRPFSGGCFPAELRRPIEVGGSGGGTDFAAGFLEGRVASAITRLELVYVNGGSDAVPVQNGFFVATVDETRMLRFTDHPVELVGYGADGAEIAREDVSNFYRGAPSGGMERPPVADVERERRLFEIATGRGSLVALYVSPSRGGGLCARVNTGAVNWEWTCAEPSTLPNPLRVGMNVVPAADGAALVFHGVVRPGLRLQFRYQDGHRDDVVAREQHFLYAVPRERWPRGKRPRDLVVLDGERVVYRVPLAVRDDALYSNTPDRLPQPPMVRNDNPTHLPLIARVSLTTQNGRRLALEVRRQTATHWYEVLLVDGRPFATEELEWVGGDRDAVLSAGYVPVLSADGSRDVFLFNGHLRAPATEARVVFADGTTEAIDVIRPNERVGGGISGFFLYEMTEARRERRPLRFEARDAGGNVVGSQRLERGL